MTHPLDATHKSRLTGYYYKVIDGVQYTWLEQIQKWHTSSMRMALNNRELYLRLNTFDEWFEETQKSKYTSEQYETAKAAARATWEYLYS